MIHRLTNRDEVEQLIKEAARDRARKTRPDGNCGAELEADIAVVLARDAEPKGISAKLSPLDFAALHWLYVAAFAEEMESVCTDMHDDHIKTMAAAVLCRYCAQPFLHVNHGDPDALKRGLEPEVRDHPFTCQHGEEVIDPRDCITDHPEAHDANH